MSTNFERDTNAHQMQTHWDLVYKTKPDEDLGWYEADAATTLDFLADVQLASKTVALVGAGTTVLARELASRGAQLCLNDLSQVALQKLIARDQLDAEQTVLCPGDLGAPLATWSMPACDIWIDRAVLHFLLDPLAIENYVARLQASLSLGGCALFIEFAPGGATRCSGLPVKQYGVAELQAVLGGGFVLQRATEKTIPTPSGAPRLYTYAIFSRMP